MTEVYFIHQSDTDKLLERIEADCIGPVTTSGQCKLPTES